MILRQIAIHALVLLSLGAWTQDSWGQAVTLAPTPTGLNDEVTLTIDVSQSAEHGLKAVLEANPDLPVYLWTWSPSDPVGGNGSWNNSNEGMLLQSTGGLKYTLTFVPSEFYTDVSALYSNGISCLAKLKDGAPYPGFDDFGEAKTEDFNVAVLPKLCEDLMCVFPESRRQDDFLSITYNNNLETYEGMQNVADDEVYLQLIARVVTASGAEEIAYVEESMVTSTPELRMRPVDGKPGFFRLTMLTASFFQGVIPEDGDIINITAFPLRPGYEYPPDSTPWNAPDHWTIIPILTCD